MGGSLEVLTDFFANHLEMVPVLGAIFAKTICRLTRAFQKTGFGHRFSTKTGHWYPLGYFLIAQKSPVSGAGAPLWGSMGA